MKQRLPVDSCCFLSPEERPAAGRDPKGKGKDGAGPQGMFRFLQLARHLCPFTVSNPGHSSSGNNLPGEFIHL